MTSNDQIPGQSGPLRPARTGPDPELRALLVRLVDTLEVTRITVDDLVRDLTSDRWQGPPPPRSPLMGRQYDDPLR